MDSSRIPAWWRQIKEQLIVPAKDEHDEGGGAADQ